MDHLIYNQEYNLYIGSLGSSNNMHLGVAPGDMLQAMQTAISLKIDMHSVFDVDYWLYGNHYILLPELAIKPGDSLEEVLRTHQKAIKYHYETDSALLIAKRKSSSYPYLCELREIATNEVKAKALAKDLPDVQIAIYRFYDDEFEDIPFLTLLKDWTPYACNQ